MSSETTGHRLSTRRPATLHTVIIAVQLLKRRGIPLEALLKGTGIVPADLEQPDTVISQAQEIIVFANALLASGDSGIGLAIGDAIPVTDSMRPKPPCIFRRSNSADRYRLRIPMHSKSPGNNASAKKPSWRAGCPATLSDDCSLVYTYDFDGTRLFQWDYLRVFMRSVALAGATTVTCLLLALPVALHIVGSPPRRKAILLLLVTVPFWTCVVVQMYGWITLLADNGLLNQWLDKLGVTRGPLGLLYTDGATLLGLVYTFVPIMILPVYAALEDLDWHIVEAALDLGATGRSARPWRSCCSAQCWPALSQGVSRRACALEWALAMNSRERLRLMPAGPVAWTVLLFLYLPLAALVWMSFNAGPSALAWQGWGIHGYIDAANDTTLRRAGIASLMQKLQAGSGGYDVAITGDYYVPILAQAGLLTKLDKSKLPNEANIKPEYRHPSFDPQRNYAMPYMIVITGYSYDSARVPGGHIDDSWKPFFDPPPAIRGQIADLDAEEELYMAASWYLGQDECSENPADAKRVLDVLQKQKPFVKTYSDDGPIDRIVSKQVIVQHNWNGASVRATEQLPSVKFVIPKEGARMLQENLVIPAKANNLAAAYRFVNWMMRPEIIAQVSNALRYNNEIAGSERFCPHPRAPDVGVFAAPVLASWRGAAFLFLREKLRFDAPRARIVRRFKVQHRIQSRSGHIDLIVTAREIGTVHRIALRADVAERDGTPQRVAERGRCQRADRHAVAQYRFAAPEHRVGMAVETERRQAP